MFCHSPSENSLRIHWHTLLDLVSSSPKHSDGKIYIYSDKSHIPVRNTRIVTFERRVERHLFHLHPYRNSSPTFSSHRLYVHIPFSHVVIFPPSKTHRPPALQYLAIVYTISAQHNYVLPWISNFLCGSFYTLD
jgi:hypothetical protein